jgi:copper(I)-binding protein
MRIFIVILLSLFFTIVKADENIVIRDLVVKPAINQNHLTTIYLNIDNLSNQLDYLLAVSVVDHPDAIVTINKTVIEKNVARVIKIDRLALPGHSTVNLAPIGIYIVINSQTEKLFVHKPVKLEFIFAKSGKKVIYL